MRIDGFREGRPSASRFKFVGRKEKRFAGGDVNIDARSEFLVVGILMWGFGGRLLCHGILHVGESASQLFVRGFSVGVFGERIGIGASGLFEERTRHMAIAAGMHVEIVLVVVLCRIEVVQRFDLDGHRSPDGGGQFCFLGHEQRAECRIGIVDAGAVLRSHVSALAVHAGRVDRSEKELDQEREGESLRVIFHLDRFGKAGLVSAHLFVGGVFYMAVGITHAGVQNAVDLFEEMLGAPEASSGKIEGCSIVHCVGVFEVVLCACASRERQPEGQPQCGDGN